VRLLDDYEDVLTHMRAADEEIADAGFRVEPTVDALAERLGAALDGARPPTAPAEHARTYDWDAIAEQAESAYRRAIDGAW
jgi:glycosyltransferase involved in cell wall biosynthesis